MNYTYEVIVPFRRSHLFVGRDVCTGTAWQPRTGNRKQGTGNREQDLDFVILNEVTHSVLRKNLNLCQQEPYRLRQNRPVVQRFLEGLRGNRPSHHKKHIFPY